MKVTEEEIQAVQDVPTPLNVLESTVCTLEVILDTFQTKIKVS
jgi:hypothetical protein